MNEIMFNTSSGLSVRRKISTGAAQQGAFLSQAKFYRQAYTVLGAFYSSALKFDILSTGQQVTQYKNWLIRVAYALSQKILVFQVTFIASVV